MSKRWTYSSKIITTLSSPFFLGIFDTYLCINLKYATPNMNMILNDSSKKSPNKNTFRVCIQVSKNTLLKSNERITLSKVIIEKLRGGRFLWNRNWDLGWIWAGSATFEAGFFMFSWAKIFFKKHCSRCIHFWPRMKLFFFLKKF